MKLLRSVRLFACLWVALLALPVAGAGEFPETWFFDRPAEHLKLEGAKAPALTVGDWVGPDFSAEDMKGNIVIVDFWATWCGPCIAGMPKNTELAEKYAKQGVKFVGVCISGDEGAMAQIAEDNGAVYPNAFAKGKQIENDWPVQWYPTYAVIDRSGTVRAIGLLPERIDDVVETLLAEEAKQDGRARVLPTWYEGDEQKRERLKDLEANADDPPALQAASWHNTEALELDQLKGKVVVLDFWATFSPKCIKSIEYHNELHDKYKADGLVFIGVCATLKSELLDEVLQQHAPRYPIMVDDSNKTSIAYQPNGFPDYYLIDKAGRLRVADCTNATLEDAIVALLAETKLDEVAPDADEAEGEAEPAGEDAAAGEQSEGV